MKKNNPPNFSYLLSPQSLAFIGASNDTNTLGGKVLINLQRSLYKGKIYPVNSEYDEIFGLKTFSNLRNIPEQIDIVVIICAVKSILSLLTECEEKKVKFIIFLDCYTDSVTNQCDFLNVLSTFSERTGIRILGPNSVGLFNISKPFGISSSLYYISTELHKGSISVITADGGLGRSILDATDRGIGFNYWISTGIETDLEVADFIQYLAYDSSTQIILVIIDGIKQIQKFEKAKAAANNTGKPLIVLDIEQGEKELQNFWEGIIPVTDLDEMMDVAWLFTKYGIPDGNRIGILSFSAGIKSLLANKCRLANLKLPELNYETKSLLHDFSPELELDMVSNPIQFPSSIFKNIGLFKEYLEIFTNDSNLDVILVPFPYKLGSYTELMVRQTVEVAKEMHKPIIPLWTSLSSEIEANYEILINSKIPFYRSTNACIRAVKHYTNYYMKRNNAIKY